MEACVSSRAHTGLSSGKYESFSHRQESKSLLQRASCEDGRKELVGKTRCSASALRQRKRLPATSLSISAPKSLRDSVSRGYGRSKPSSRCRFRIPRVTPPSQKKKGSRCAERYELKAAVCWAGMEKDAADGCSTDDLCSCPEDVDWDGGWFGGRAPVDDREDDDLCNVHCVQRWHQLDSSARRKLLLQEEVVEIVDVGNTSPLSVQRHPFGLTSGHEDGVLSPPRWRTNGVEPGEPNGGDLHLDELAVPVNLGLAEGGFSADISADIDVSPPLNWPYERPARDELADLQVDVALAIPSWYYRISGKQQDVAYGHDLEEEETNMHTEETESLEAKNSPRSIILIPPYQRVALATELLIASFTGGGISSDDATDHQVHSFEEKKLAALANLPSLPLEGSVSVVDWEEWDGRAELDAPGFFLAPDEEALLSRLSSNTSNEWDPNASPSESGDASSAHPLQAWPVLFAAVVVGCLAGLMAMKSEAPVLAIDLLLITWSATITAVAAACVGVLRRNGADKSVPQTTAYEAPSKQALWSRVVLIMGFIAGSLAASTCLALIVRSTVSMLMLVGRGIASFFSKVVGAASLEATLHSVSASSAGSWTSLVVAAEELAKAVPHLLWGCAWAVFLVSMPVLLVVIGLLLISGGPDSSTAVKS